MQITIRPTYKQHLAYEALRDPNVDTVFFGGGAGGGKSWSICESRLVNALRFPGYKSYIGREELKRLMQSTFQTFVKVSQFHKIPEGTWSLNGQYNYIDFANSSRIDLLDLKFLPTDPLYERFGSLEYTDGAIEEAGEVEFLSYDVLKTRVGRHRNREFNLHATTLITGNPKKNWTYQKFYKPYKNGTLPLSTRFIQSLYSDNITEIAEDYGKQLESISDKANKERLMFGNWEYDDDPATLITYEAITDMWSNPTPENQVKFITADIARYGSDKIVIMVWNGLQIYKIYVYSKQDTVKTAQAIRDIARNENVGYSNIIIDEDGIGGGVVDQLPGTKGFIANSSPFEITTATQNYQNLKAQCAYTLADRINARLVSIDLQTCTGEPEELVNTLLIEDLEQIKSKDMDRDGKLKIMPKEEVKEHIGRSPDYGDNLIMRMYFEVAGLSQGGIPPKTFRPQVINRNPIPRHQVE